MERRAEPRIPVDQRVLLTILGEPGRTLNGMVANLSGRGMRIILDSPLPLETAVRLELDDSLYLGEVCYCEKYGGEFAVGLELQEALSGLQNLRGLMRALMQEERHAEKADAGLPARS